MFRRTSQIKGFILGARDGEGGLIKDLLFDEESWSVRHLVAATGRWLSKRQVLISAQAILGFQDRDKLVEVDLTKEQIENSLSLDLEGPDYGQVTDPRDQTSPLENSADEPDRSGDPHLLSVKKVTGDYVQARDGEVGHVEDFLIDDEDWVIDYLVVVVSEEKCWPGRRVLVSSASVARVDWQQPRVYLGLDREVIECAPECDMSRPISREYQARVFSYYNPRPDWSKRAAA